MFIIQNKYIPFGNYKAITLYPFIFTHAELSYTDYNHESIHAQQQKEMLVVFFYLVYVIEFLARLIRCRNWNMAYRNISFEQEAYTNQGNMLYIKYRKHYSSFKFM